MHAIIIRALQACTCMEANAWKYKLAPGEYVCMHVCMYACKEMHVACALQAAKGPREEHRVERMVVFFKCSEHIQKKNYT